MSDAYRDDLAAALARASDLEREVVELRKRNAELQSGDRETIEARENARRLEAALEREREELRQHHEQDVETEGRVQAARILGTQFPPAPQLADPFAWHRRGIAIISILAGLLAAVAGAKAELAGVKTESGTLEACFVALIVIGVFLLSVDADASAGRSRRTR